MDRNVWLFHLRPFAFWASGQDEMISLQAKRTGFLKSAPVHSGAGVCAWVCKAVRVLRCTLQETPRASWESSKDFKFLVMNPHQSTSVETCQILSESKNAYAVQGPFPSVLEHATFAVLNFLLRFLLYCALQAPRARFFPRARTVCSKCLKRALFLHGCSSRHTKCVGFSGRTVASAKSALNSRASTVDSGRVPPFLATTSSPSRSPFYRIIFQSCFYSKKDLLMPVIL